MERDEDNSGRAQVEASICAFGGKTIVFTEDKAYIVRKFRWYDHLWCHFWSWLEE